MSVDNNYFVHKSSFVDDNVKVGEGSKIWHFSHIQSNSIIGRNCSIGQNVNIANNVIIGNNVKIQNNVSVYEGVQLDDYVFCGPSMVFTNVLRPRSEFPQRGSKFYHKTLVKKSATLGANCTIVCGVIVGEYAVVAAGAVVTKDIPPYALYAGNPAKFLYWVDKELNKLSFNENDISKCGKFRREKDRLIEIL
tara:strand:- start:10139 stop:10717 length:579 start_codon:yes stop_codon:yes gene_type:complete